MRNRPSKGLRRDSGATAVEFALVFPVVILVTFGIMEFALVLRDYNGVTNLARDASRIASANPRVGNVDGHRGKPPPDGTAPAGAQASFAYLASQVVESSGNAIPKDSIVDMWVYLANPEGYPVLRSAPNDPTESVNWKQDRNRTMTCTEDDYCVRYRWVDSTGPSDPGGFRWVSGIWNPLSINACSSNVPAELAPTTIPDRQAVGVFIRVQHRSITPLFNTTRTISDRNVVAFEPMPAANCK